jgi:hypothetical protein
MRADLGFCVDALIVAVSWRIYMGHCDNVGPYAYAALSVVDES